MRILYPLSNVQDKDFENSIFLAGPMLRSDDFSKMPTTWRDEVCDILDKKGFDGVVLSPQFVKKPEEWTYSRQLDWEIKGMTNAKVILFWIPRSEELPGFTTNIEFGEWMHSKKITVGAPKDADRIKYIEERCKRENIDFTNSMETLVDNAMGMLGLAHMDVKIWFTSDTHFSQQRTLELSKRPFQSINEMDWEMVKRWNEKVGEEDIVYHLGDFGDTKFLPYLKCKKMYIVRGNLDDANTIDNLLKDSRVEEVSQAHLISLMKNGDRVVNVRLIHKPVFTSNRVPPEDSFYLFGHIHNLSMIKQNGFNVGVDCHNFTPVSEDTVLFYYDAISKHYDINVFTDKCSIDNPS